MPANKRKLRVPDNVILRECSVVIIGSRCKICGRDFKCMSDVAMHTNWRHNGAIKSLYDSLDKNMYLENVGKICDMCNGCFETASELKIHKKLIHNHSHKKRRKKETVLVRFKLKGAITREVYLNKKYFNVLSQNDVTYFIDVGVQTENLEDEKHQDVFVTNIDFSLTNYIVDNGHVEDNMPPHKDANRYIVGEFATTKGDAVAPSSVMMGGKSPIEISNALHEGAEEDSGNFNEKNSNCYSVSEEDPLILPSSFADDVNIHDKENLRSITHESENVYYPNKLLSDSSEVLLVSQHTFTETLSNAAETSLLNENRYDSVRRFNEDAVNKERRNSLVDSTKNVTVVNNSNEAEKKHPSVSRKQKVKEKFVRPNVNVDDEVQEVLRITRRHVQSDINHESPNRTEREILVRHVKETFPTGQKLLINPEKCNTYRTKSFQTFGYSPFMNANNNAQFSDKMFDKEISKYFEDLNRYGIKFYNDFPEINNNIEECMK